MPKLLQTLSYLLPITDSQTVQHSLILICIDCSNLIAGISLVDRCKY